MINDQSYKTNQTKKNGKKITKMESRTRSMKSK